MPIDDFELKKEFVKKIKSLLSPKVTTPDGRIVYIYKTIDDIDDSIYGDKLYIENAKSLLYDRIKTTGKQDHDYKSNNDG